MGALGDYPISGRNANSIWLLRVSYPGDADGRRLRHAASTHGGDVPACPYDCVAVTGEEIGGI